MSEITLKQSPGRMSISSKGGSFSICRASYRTSGSYSPYLQSIMTYIKEFCKTHGVGTLPALQSLTNPAILSSVAPNWNNIDDVQIGDTVVLKGKEAEYGQGLVIDIERKWYRVKFERAGIRRVVISLLSIVEKTSAKTIVSVMYGWGSQRIDITDKFLPRFRLSNKMAGSDPVPGKKKTAIVTFSDGTEIELAEGKVLDNTVQLLAAKFGI